MQISLINNTSEFMDTEQSVLATSLNFTSNLDYSHLPNVTILANKNDTLIEAQEKSEESPEFETDIDETMNYNFKQEKLKNQYNRELNPQKNQIINNRTYEAIENITIVNHSQINETTRSVVQIGNYSANINPLENNTICNLTEPCNNFQNETNYSIINESDHHSVVDGGSTSKKARTIRSIQVSAVNTPKISATNIRLVATPNISLTSISSITHCNNKFTTILKEIENSDIEKLKSFSLKTFGLDLEKINWTEALENLKEELAKNKNEVVELSESVKMAKKNHEEALAILEKKSKCINEQRTKLNENNEILEKLMCKATQNKNLIDIFNFKESDLEKSQNELKNLIEKNKNNEKEYEEAQNKNIKLKSKIRNDFDKLKSIQIDRDEKEKYHELCEKIFNDENIPFKLADFDNDRIVLSYMNDFLQLEIKATNIVGDLNSKKTTQAPNDLNEILTQQKCLNYPIQEINLRKVITFEKNLSKRKVPIYMLYCIDLVLAEIGEGDLTKLKSNKYKYVKDLPLLISHMNLSCKCASNLAKDFDYFATILSSKNEFSPYPKKCDFDFKNRIVSFIIPSKEDACRYNLKLKLLPKCYYQLPIHFTIDQNNLDEEFFEPNIEKITKQLEGQYFENGSLRNYLKRLNINIEY